MIVMVFEFSVPEEQLDEYQRESTELRRHLADIEGFISVERFASTAAPGKFVAIGYFEDEKAVTRWRNLPQHRRAQALGRTRFFSRYRLVMAETLRDYSHELRDQSPEDSRAAHGS
jgi:heme-degrading monooxygenase HmoA